MNNIYTKNVYCIDCGCEITKRAIRCHSCAGKINNPSREGNSNWRGGQNYQHGYVWIYQPNHPFCQCNGYIKRARVILEASSGYLIPSMQCIHHKNGIKDDDRIENLEIISRSEHQIIHNKKAGCRNSNRDSKGRFI